jgi:uroporphyrin-III C-methyltransferase
MSESSKSPDPSAAQATPVAAPSTLAVSSLRNMNNASKFQKAMVVACVLLALLLAAHWWTARIETSDLREEIARRLQVGDSANTETKTMASTTYEGVKELQTKVAALEAKQTETQSQQLALAQLYQDLSKNRDDWALSEIEQVLSTANQQLQLSGNVQGALIALQNADRSLARLDKPQFIQIRRAITRDMDKLKSLPNVDLTGIALRLDSVISQVDKLPLYADEKPPVQNIQPKSQRRSMPKEEDGARGSATRAQAAEWWGGIQDKWYSWSNEMWNEIKQLIRVRNVEEPDALLVSPSQAYFIRENLKLRLLNARLALLTRNEAAFRSDMQAAQDALNKYFDSLAKQTQSTQAILKQVQASNLSIELPALESLSAVNNFKTKH